MGEAIPQKWILSLWRRPDEELCHIFNQILIKTQVYQLVLKICQLIMSLHHFSQFPLYLAIFVYYISQVCLLFIQLLLQILVVLVPAWQLWLVILLHWDFILAHHHLYLWFLIFDSCTWLKLHAFDKASFQTKFASKWFVFSMQKF